MTVSNADDDNPVNAVPPAPLSPATLRKQRVLLAVVIILGVAIVVAFAVLVVALIFGPGRTAAPAVKPWAYTLDVAPGTHVESASAEGGRIVLRLAGPQGEDVVLIDAASGNLTGRIHLQPAR